MTDVSNSPPIEIGKRYRFAYPEHFVTLPEYSARRGTIVTIVRPLTEDEAEPPDAENGFTQMYRVRADDGWEGDAWDEELEELDQALP